MITMRFTTDVPSDRNLILSLPGDVPVGPAEVVLTVESRDTEREKTRAEAVDRFLALARASTFRSTEPYPSRDELHERD